LKISGSSEITVYKHYFCTVRVVWPQFTGEVAIFVTFWHQFLQHVDKSVPQIIKVG